MSPKCVICKKVAKNFTIWTTFGNYGSTIFDPMDGSYLECNICDKCLPTLMATHKKDLVKTKTTIIKRNFSGEPLEEAD